MVFHLGCHLSVMLKEEQEKIDPEVVKKVVEMWQGKPVEIVIDKMFFYIKKDKHNKKKLLLALNVWSDGVLEIREDLGLERKPNKFVTHITLLEKNV